ncbi:MAG: hypothetical protein LBR94_04305 [Desulfovibrio sp.]|jgi:hypothetical protein|nr:hypothetical protein [Desulfovibrio sp.]
MEILFLALTALFTGVMSMFSVYGFMVRVTGSPSGDIRICNPRLSMVFIRRITVRGPENCELVRKDESGSIVNRYGKTVVINHGIGGKSDTYLKYYKVVLDNKVCPVSGHIVWRTFFSSHVDIVLYPGEQLTSKER